MPYTLWTQAGVSCWAVNSSPSFPAAALTLLQLKEWSSPHLLTWANWDTHIISYQNAYLADSFQVDIGLPYAQIKSKSSRGSVLQSQEIYFNTERPRERLSSKPITLASETTSRATNRCRTPTFCKRCGASLSTLPNLLLSHPEKLPADDKQTMTTRLRTARFWQGSPKTPSTLPYSQSLEWSQC